MVRDTEPHPPIEPTLFISSPQGVALLQTVLDSLTYPLYVIDVADYHVSLANRAAQESCRGGAATCYALTHRRDTPCDSQDHPCPIEVIQRTGKPTVVEHVHYDAAGTAKNVEVHAFPIFNDAGQVVQIIEYCVDITERKRAEEDLKRSESILAQAGEMAHLGAWEIEFTASDDINQNPLRWSDEVYRIFGYEPGAVAVSNELFFRHVHPEDRQRVVEAVAQAIAAKHPYRIEHRIVRPDGTERIVLEHAEIKFDDQGRPLQMIGAVQDITEHRQADRALRDSEERLRATFDNAGVGLVEAEANDRIIAVNDRLCQILGYRREELLGKTVHELTAPEDRTASDDLNVQFHKGRTDRIDYEKRYLKRDGVPLWVHVTVSAVHDAEGLWRRSIATVEDISERKLAETALRLSERRLKSTFENAAVGITHVGLDGRFLRFNDRFCAITGYPRADLAAKSFQEITHPDDLSAEVRERQRLQRGEIGHYSLDKRYIRPDGSVIWVSLTASVQQENGGAPEYFIAIVEDISQRKQMEEALRDWNTTLETKVAQRTAELEQRARQLQRLTLELSEAEDQERQRLAEILHDDLQQILAAAKFHLGLLRHRVKQDPAQQAITGQIEHMLKEAIEKSRSLSHELSPAVLRHGDFGETLRWLAEQVQAKHGLVVHVHAFGRIEVQSEALTAFLYKASQETLFNVVKHARVNEARLRVRRLGRYVCLSVSDRGRGFDPQELKAAAGFGLLSIRERIELLGGRMKIKSVPGRGSTFFIVVPDSPKPEDRGRKTEDGGPKADDGLLSSVLGPRSSGPTLRVLIADDHEIVREGLISLLREEHAIEIVGAAANGREAVDLAGRLQPDVVIMDVSMPLINGADATRQIKTHLPQTRVVALSMYDTPETIETMYRAGAESYVLKTAPSEELLAAVRGKTAPS